jgi:hypothetical protein
VTISNMLGELVNMHESLFYQIFHSLLSVSMARQQ